MSNDNGKDIGHTIERLAERIAKRACRQWCSFLAHYDDEVLSEAYVAAVIAANHYPELIGHGHWLEAVEKYAYGQLIYGLRMSRLLPPQGRPDRFVSLITNTGPGRSIVGQEHEAFELVDMLDELLDTKKMDLRRCPGPRRRGIIEARRIIASRLEVDSED